MKVQTAVGTSVGGGQRAMVVVVSRRRHIPAREGRGKARAADP